MSHASHDQAATAPIIEMRGIVKRFGQTTALNNVDLTIQQGEVHAIVGENGAGKSTLMHILTGELHADRGQISIRGKPVSIQSVENANALGIAMVHQHFMLFPSLTVAENLTLGREPRLASGLFDRARAAKAVRELGERYNLKVNPNARVSDLSVGDLQRLEILRALYRGANILILDEPTAVLTPQEAQGLFRVIRELQRDGKTTLFISHKLEEVLDISEVITVLRDGHVTGTLQSNATTAHQIARLMVGRDVFFQFTKPQQAAGQAVLEIRQLSGKGIHNLSLTVHAHEIVGIAGVTGNGQTELADLIAGLAPASGGTITINGRDAGHLSVAQRRRAGLANIPEDRYKDGLAAGANVSDNLLIGVHDRLPLVKRGLLQQKAILQRAQELIGRFQIKTESAESLTATLSGGNAQKVIIARELAEDKSLIVAAQPTRGIDIAASEFVREALLQRRNQGAGILLISADLSEILSLSDRILVMYAGRIIGELSAQEATETRLGLLMTGITTGATDAQ